MSLTNRRTGLSTVTVSSVAGNFTAGKLATTSCTTGAADSQDAANADLVICGDGICKNTFIANTIKSDQPADINSDFRLKQNFRTIQNPFYPMFKIQGLTYDYRNTGKSSMGFIAQNIERYFPFLVKTNSKGIKSMQYTPLIAWNWEANKYNQVQIRQLKEARRLDRTEIQQLKERNVILANKLDVVLNRLDALERPRHSTTRDSRFDHHTKVYSETYKPQHVRRQPHRRLGFNFSKIRERVQKLKHRAYRVHRVHRAR